MRLRVVSTAEMTVKGGRKGQFEATTLSFGDLNSLVSWVAST